MFKTLKPQKSFVSHIFSGKHDESSNDETIIEYCFINTLCEMIEERKFENENLLDILTMVIGEENATMLDKNEKIKKIPMSCIQSTLTKQIIF